VPVEVLDDDAGLRHDPIAGAIVQHRDLSHRPARRDLGGGSRIGEIDDVLLERGAVLVKRHEHLVTERSQRMGVQRKRHDPTSGQSHIAAPARPQASLALTWTKPAKS
jgi:hypothetical protein